MSLGRFLPLEWYTALPPLPLRQTARREKVGLGGGLAREEAAPWQAKFAGVAGVAISGLVEGGVGTQTDGALNGVLAIVGQEPISMKLNVAVAGLRDFFNCAAVGSSTTGCSGDWRRCGGVPKEARVVRDEKLNEINLLLVRINGLRAAVFGRAGFAARAKRG